MWQWLRCLFGSHETNGKWYPWNWYTRTAVCLCRHCGAVMEQDFDREVFDGVFGMPAWRQDEEVT